jgi:hypothetical protein
MVEARRCGQQPKQPHLSSLNFKQTQRVIALNLIRIDDAEMMISRFKVRKVSSHVKWVDHTFHFSF